MQKTFFTLSVVYIFSVLPFCYAQSPPPPPPPPRPVKVVGKAQVFYSRESNLSHVNVDFTLLGTIKNILREDVFQVTIAFSVPGEKITRPQTVDVRLYSYTHGTDYRYKEDHRVEVLIDNKVIASGIAKPSFANIDPRGGVTETYNTAMSFDLLNQILNAKTAGLQFGKTKFDFNAEAISALKDIQRVIE